MARRGSMGSCSNVESLRGHRDAGSVGGSDRNGASVTQSFHPGCGRVSAISRNFEVEESLPTLWKNCCTALEGGEFRNDTETRRSAVVAEVSGRGLGSVSASSRCCGRSRSAAVVRRAGRALRLLIVALSSRCDASTNDSELPDV